MKKNKISIAAMCTVIFIAASVWTSTAQPPQNARPTERPAMNEGQPRKMTAEESARRKADILREELDLSDKQYKKVYKLYRRQADRELSASRSKQSWDEGGMPGGGRMGPRGGMQGGMPGGSPGGMGMPGGGGRPPAMGDMPAGGTPKDMGEPYMEDEKDVAAREKKMKKILSAEQYTKWYGWEQGELQMRARRMWQQDMQQPEERDGQRPPERNR